MKPFYLPDHRAFLRYIEIPGENPPLVWLHGWQCSSTAELLPTAVQPPLRGRRSILVDFLGHGYSDRPHEFGYGLEDHARTIDAFIDALELSECGLVGHSMGGAVAVHVAAARPSVVSLVVMAEGVVDAHGEPVFDGQSEDLFVERGFGELVHGQANDAQAHPHSVPAAHLGMTQLLEPRAIYPEDVSMRDGTDLSVRSLLREPTDATLVPAGGAQRTGACPSTGLAEMGVRWKVVPNAGHPMGLQNPEGLADTVADVPNASWLT